MSRVRILDERKTVPYTIEASELEANNRQCQWERFLDSKVFFENPSALVAVHERHGMAVIDRKALPQVYGMTMVPARSGPLGLPGALHLKTYRWVCFVAVTTSRHENAGEWKLYRTKFEAMDAMNRGCHRNGRHRSDVSDSGEVYYVCPECSTPTERGKCPECGRKR